MPKMVHKNTLFILHPQTNHHLTSPKAHKLVLCNGHDSVWQLANIDLDWVNCRDTWKLLRHSVHNLTLQRCMTSNMLSHLDISNCHQLARQQSDYMSTGPTQTEEMAKQSANWCVFAHTNFFVKISTLPFSNDDNRLNQFNAFTQWLFVHGRMDHKGQTGGNL
jgi:hypothetical protein